MFRNVHELFHEAGGLQAAHDDGIRPTNQHSRQGGQMVGFHMVDNDVVQHSSCQHSRQVLHELRAHGLVNRVQKNGLLVNEDVRIVGGATRDGHHILKKGQSSVGCTDIPQIV